MIMVKKEHIFFFGQHFFFGENAILHCFAYKDSILPAYGCWGPAVGYVEIDGAIFIKMAFPFWGKLPPFF